MDPPETPTSSSLSTSSLLAKSSCNILALLKSRMASSSFLLLSEERIILEIGPHLTKIGFGGEEAPRFVFQNSHSCDCLEAPSSSDPLWTFPIDRILPKFSLRLSDLLSDIFLRHLLIESKGKSVIIPEPSFLTLPIKESIVTVLFEQFKVNKTFFRWPTVLFVSSALMVVLTTGKDDGLSIECNEQDLILTPVIHRLPIHVFALTLPLQEEIWEDFPELLKKMIMKCSYDDRLRMLNNVVLFGDANPSLFELLFQKIQDAFENSPWSGIYRVQWPGNGAFQHGAWVGTSLAASLKIIDMSKEIKQQHYENWCSGISPLICDWSIMIEPR